MFHLNMNIKLRLLIIMSREMRAPMVANMRGIAPKQPEDVRFLKSFISIIIIVFLGKEFIC